VRGPARQNRVANRIGPRDGSLGFPPGAHTQTFREGYRMRYRDYAVVIETMERILGSSPGDPEIYRKYIANSPSDPDRGAGSPEREEEEVNSLPQVEEKGLTVFPRDGSGCLHMWDFQVKGYLKEAGNILKDQLRIRGLRDKVDNYVYVFPRRILFQRDGQLLTQPDGVFARPLRAMTMQGPRVSIAISEYVEPPIRLEFGIRLLEHKELNETVLQEILEFGQLKGLGQWRNGSWGRFRVLDFRELGPATVGEITRKAS